MKLKRRTLNIVIAFFVILIYLIINNFNSIRLSLGEARWQTIGIKGNLENGTKQGEWKNYFINGQLAEIKNYVNDTLHGKHIGFTPSGQYTVIEYYNMGNRIDTFKMFSNGKLNLIEYYDSTGLKQGEFRIYVDDSLSQIGQYKDGKMNGEYRNYDYKTGRLTEIIYYVNNERAGKWIYFNENGDTIKIENYEK